MIFDKYPYTNFHEMNDDWIIQTMKMMDSKLDEFVAMNSLTYADPIAYNVETTYPANTVVIYNETAYVSKQAVSAGVLPTVGGDYWLEIFPFGEMFNQYSTSTFDVLSARVDAYIAAANDQLSAAINNLPTLVNNWLADHPDVTTTVQDGSISWLKLNYNLQSVLLAGYDLTTMINIDNFEQGAINITTGEDVESSILCRTPGFLQFPDGIALIRTVSDFRIQVFQYALDGTYESRILSLVQTTWQPFITDANHKYRVSISYDNYASLTPSDLPLIPVACSINQLESVNAVRNAIASTYSDTALYVVGSHVWYNETLYRCISEITTAEAWTSEHWTPATLSDEIDLCCVVDGIQTNELYSKQGNEYYANSLFDSGYISSADGSYGSNSKNCRSSVFLPLEKIKAFMIPLGYRAKIFWYSDTSNNSYISATPYEQCGDGIINYFRNYPSTAKYFRLVLVNNEVTSISAEDRAALSSSIVFYTIYESEQKELQLTDLFDKAYSDQVPYSASNVNWYIEAGQYKSDGTAGVHTKYNRTLKVDFNTNQFAVSVDDNYAVKVYFYNGTSFIKSVALRSDVKKILVEAPSETTKIAFDFHRKDWETMTVTDTGNISSSFKVYRSVINSDTAVITQDQSRAAFVEYMNDMCDYLGLSDSTFINACGQTWESVVSARDELKLCIAVAGNPIALDIWSTKDRDFSIGGTNARTLSITSNVYSSEPVGSIHKILGGKGGSLQSTANGYRRARTAIYDVNGAPVSIAVIGGGEFTYNNIMICAHDLLNMMATKMNGGTPTESESLSHLVSDGGGYAAVPVPVCSGAFLNSYSSADLLSRENAIYRNASASQTPASTTKILTMLCALRIADDLQEVITIVGSDVTSGSGSAFAAGDKLTLEDAMRIMMMESSNTLAEAIGRVIGKKLLDTDARRQ